MLVKELKTAKEVLENAREVRLRLIAQRRRPLPERKEPPKPIPAPKIVAPLPKPLLKIVAPPPPLPALFMRTPRQAILHIVSRRNEMPVAVIMSDIRTKPVAQARHIVFYMLREVLFLSFPRIGRFMHRDHSTVVSGCQSVRDRCVGDVVFAHELAQAREECVQAREKCEAAIAQDQLSRSPA